MALNNLKIIHTTQIIASLVLCLVILKSAEAQKCATHERLLILQEKNNAAYNSVMELRNSLNSKSNQRQHDVILSADEVYKFQIVVHVMHNSVNGTIGGDNNSNVTDEQIFSQIEVINEDFRRLPNTKGFNTNPIGTDTRLEYCLASIDPTGKPTTGINRVYYSTSSFNYLDLNEEIKLKKMSYWPSNKYINIWVTNFSNKVIASTTYPSLSGLEGLDQSETSPELDGVLIDFRAFGRTGTAASPVQYGHTLTHELGHYFGLLHIWGDALCGEDYISDTPPQSGSNIGLALNCPPTFSTCNKIKTQDMSSNYMDYSPDVCLNTFTVQQAIRMRKAIQISPSRAALLKNNNTCHYLNVMQMSKIDGIVVQLSDKLLTIKTEVYLPGIFIKVYDMLGNELYTATTTINASSEYKIPLFLPSSLYMIHIFNQQKFYTQKFYVE